MLPFERSYRMCLFLGTLVMFAFSAHAKAQSIEDARGLWFDADFEASRDAFTAVLASPRATRTEALDAHRYLAALFLVLHDEPLARAHADAALALDADVVPPEGAPSAAVELFRMARRRLGGRTATLTIVPSAPLRYDEAARIVARLDPAPAALAQTLVLRCGEDEASGPPPSVTLDVEPRADVTCTASATTESGAVLLALHETFETSGGPVASPVIAPSRAPERDTSHRGRRWAIAGAVLALAVGGVVTTVVVYDRNHGDVPFSGTTVVGW